MIDRIVCFDENRRVIDTPDNPTPDAHPAAPADPSLATADFLRLVPLEFARERLLVSQGRDHAGREVVAAVDGPDLDLLLHNLAARLRRPVVARPADPESIAAALDELAGRLASEAPASGDSGSSETIGLEGASGVDAVDLAEVLAADERDLLKTAGRAPVVKLVNALLFEALARGASDLHVQPAQDDLAVRFRVDGVLLDARRLPRKLLLPVVSRIKVMARMDIAERRLPQDGRATVTIGAKEIDLRVSSLPTAAGERVVVRLLDKRRVDFFDLERLGMPGPSRRRFEAVCARPYGMALVTGPTGSGKTTTLYSALRRMNTAEQNVLTLEDPIEYELPGVSQSQINTRKGVTFATGLRHLLRQDPDVIMVGEIRDAETARTAIQAALTGHLVLSTLHTNSAASAVTRLVDLGVEPYLVSASLSAVLAQRLVRTVCPACGGPGVGPSCERCAGVGYRGRMGLFELLVVDARIRELIGAGASTAAIEQAARRAGMQTLREAGLAAVAAGATTRDEVDRATLLDDDLEQAAAPGPEA